MKPLDYHKVFETLIEKTREYLVNNRIHSMILGISGGIDSTIVAAICSEVNKRTGIPLIGRSLPTKHNKPNEKTAAEWVGKAFCNNFGTFQITDIYHDVRDIIIEDPSKQTAIANGNIQARLRMIYLYNLASIYKGIVFSTDNATEYNLGFWTLHGDVGDFNPLFGLWKSEIFELARWLVEFYTLRSNLNSNSALINEELAKVSALTLSLSLVPTDGLGITSSDLEQIGGKSYEEVDFILQEILSWKKTTGIENISAKEQKELFLSQQKILNTDIDTVRKVADRHFASEFKRKNLPIVIPRDNYQLP